MNLKLVKTKLMKSLYTYLPASAVSKIRKFLLFNRNMRRGKRGNTEQRRKYQTWNWDGNSAPVQ
jgi:hypothetical protein